MAIIKCPECGHTVSDKAPVCPSCGVEIAGRITHCVQCGEVYFITRPTCPDCNHATVRHETNENNDIPSEKKGFPGIHSDYSSGQEDNGLNQQAAQKDITGDSRKSEKTRTTGMIVAVVLSIAVAIGGIGIYFYLDSKQTKEQAAYEYALTSKDPAVLQSFLDNYKDAPQNHIQTIMALLAVQEKNDLDWHNALVSNSKTALLDYLESHPDSKHKVEALRKTDSLDWAFASSVNTLAAYNQYMNEHPNGEYVDRANEAVKTIKVETVSPEERKRISLSLARFFQSINARDENGLISSTAELMSSFLGKANATQADVIAFMNKIYKEDITGMNWRVNDDYKINKKEIGDEEYEYSVSFSAVQEIERNDIDKEKEIRYKISAKINPDGKITEMNMIRILKTKDNE